MRPKYLYIICMCLFLVACGDVVTPKPRSYFRITLPEQKYERFDTVAFPYSFEKSAASNVVADKAEDAEPYWINIDYPSMKCKIHVTYKSLKNSDLDEALEDSRRLVYKHTIKADAIGESYFENDTDRVYGVLYQIKGNAATPLQFSLTDSLAHLFRGSLYFYCKPNKDSLAPVVAYLEDDIAHIMETFNWK